MTSRAVAASLYRCWKKHPGKNADLKKRSDHMQRCCNYLVFGDVVNQVTGEVTRKLQAAEFCRDRLCPMCSWRKSLVTFSQLSDIMLRIDSTTDGLVPIFLTLTMRNCVSSDLADRVTHLLKAWSRMTSKSGRRKPFRIAVGWFRALEITYNKKDGTWHPHMHVEVVPVAESKRGLSVQNSLNKAVKQAGHDNYKDMLAGWDEVLDTAMKDHGLERVAGDRDKQMGGVDMRTYKRSMEVRKQTAEAEARLECLRQRADGVARDVEELRPIAAEVRGWEAAGKAERGAILDRICAKCDGLASRIRADVAGIRLKVEELRSRISRPLEYLMRREQPKRQSFDDVLRDAQRAADAWNRDHAAPQRTYRGRAR